MDTQPRVFKKKNFTDSTSFHQTRVCHTLCTQICSSLGFMKNILIISHKNIKNLQSVLQMTTLFVFAKRDNNQPESVRTTPVDSHSLSALFKIRSKNKDSFIYIFFRFVIQPRTLPFFSHKSIHTV